MTYISSKLGEAIYDGKKISSLRESYKQDSKLLQEALGQNPAAKNVNVDGLIKDMRNIQMDANKEGVKLASDLLAATDPIKPSGSGSEIEKAVGLGINQAVDTTKTAVEAQGKLDQARDAQEQKQQPPPAQGKDEHAKPGIQSEKRP